MIKGKYAAIVEINFAIREDDRNLLPFEQLRENVRNLLTPELQKLIVDECGALGVVNVQQTYADLYIEKEGGTE